MATVHNSQGARKLPVKHGRKRVSGHLRCILQGTVYVSMSVAIACLLLSLFYLEFEAYVPPTKERRTSSIGSSTLASIRASLNPDPIPTRDSQHSLTSSPGTLQSKTPPLLSPSPPSLSFSSSREENTLPPCMPNPAVVVVAHNRERYLKQSLAALLRASGSDLFQIYVSLDSPGDYGNMEMAVSSIVREFMDSHYAVDPDIKFFRMQPRSNSPFERSGIGRISRHHQFALEQGLQVNNHSHLIVLEEDLIASSDFFTLFIAAAPLLEQDHSLFCISAWNDNGEIGVAWDLQRLYRTDYFAGLGWMIKRSDWTQRLRSKWPEVPSTGWDHWMRLPTSNDNRECVVPEVSRTKHIGDQGVNVKSGQQNIYSRWAFANIQQSISHTSDSNVVGLNSTAHFGDLSYLLHHRYEEHVMSVVERAYENQAIVLYTLESWPTTAGRHRLWRNQPRGTHRGLILVHNADGSYKVLADRRKALDYLRPEDVWRPNPNAKIIAGERGLSCNHACAREGLRCDRRELQFVNTCAEILKAFPCEAGCGHQMGYEIPSYVVDPGERTFRQCLVADEVVSTCEAQHPITRRLCACLT